MVIDGKRFINDLGYYLLSSILILDMRVMWGFLSTTPSSFFNLKIALLGISILFIIFTENRIRFKDFYKSLLITVALLFYLLAYFILQDYNRELFSKYMLVVLFLIFFEFLLPNRMIKVLEKFSTLVYIIGIISLFFWIFGSLLHIIAPSSPVLTSWSGTDSYRAVYTYYNIYYETQSTTLANLLPMGFIRNSAIFTEAPMASLNFSIALMIEKLAARKFSATREFILIILILSTGAFTGIGFLALLYSSLWLKNSSSASRNKKILITFVGLILTLLTVWGIQKLVIQKMTVTSGQIRLDDYILMFNVWREHKFLGVGIGNNASIIQNMSVARAANIGLSNSIGQVLAHGGIYISVLYAYSFLKPFITGFKTNDSILSVLLFYLFVSTIFSYQFMLIFLLIYFTLNSKTKLENYLVYK